MSEAQMTDLASRVEVTKLARELLVDESELAFLTSRSPAELRELRASISAALFARHESRFKRVGVLATLVPPSLAAKIAQLALGPFLAARVASVLEPAEAIKLARHLDPAFIAELAPSLDPTRVAAIVAGLPQALVVDVGKRLLADEHLTLGRFVAVVSTDTALQVVKVASPEDLLQVALLTEDTSVLDAIVQRLDDQMLAGVIGAAIDQKAYVDAVTLLSALSLESRRRLIRQLSAVDQAALPGFVDAIAVHRLWGEVLPALGAADEEVLKVLAGAPTVRDVDLLDDLVRTAYELDLAPVLVKLVLVLDDDLVQLVGQTRTLAQPEVRAWLLETSGVTPRLVEPVLEALGF